ncbi:hypothetical protein HYQ45_008269 [Verticillium longisporum]|uniref:Xylanolytic transcriptional activator regulatory domain-containing protein n=1 Tax=Verticillium longisporum TaxID=100787 RepID=A0A8I2ZNN6_VERLO|nr:hypothetical protein HYQ45_008269 [Verticillium longisporum]
MYDHGSSGAFAPPVLVSSTSFGNLLDDQDTLSHETPDALLDYRLAPALAGPLVPTHHVAPTLNTTGSWFYPIPTWEYGMDIDIEDFRAATESRYAKTPDTQYSQVSNQANLATSLRELLSEAILDRVGCNPRVIGDLAFGQAVLLSQLLLQCSGSLASSLRSQYQKGILTAICRSVVSKNGSLFRTGKAVSRPWRRAEDWPKWIEQESWTRLAFFSLFLEHIQAVIWDINPPIEVADIHRQLPDSDRLWACTSAIEWEKQRMMYPPKKPSKATAKTSRSPRV